jgi:hypothetical protein
MHRRAAKPKMKARHVPLRQSAEGIDVIELGKGYPVNLFFNLGKSQLREIGKSWDPVQIPPEQD